MTRWVCGLVLPYEVEARGGLRRWRIASGAVDWPARVWLHVDHDRAQRVGYAARLRHTPAGVRGCFIARDPRAATRHGFSADLDFDELDRVRGVFVARRARITEVSLTDHPVFAAARIDPACDLHER